MHPIAITPMDEGSVVHLLSEARTLFLIGETHKGVRFLKVHLGP
jgi:hypothetical protein